MPNTQSVVTARWFFALRDNPSGVIRVKACRYHNRMGVTPCEGLRPRRDGRPTLPQNLHRVLVRFRLGCWELEVNRPNNDHERAVSTCRLGVCGAVEDELHVFMECPAYDSLRAKCGSDLGFQRRGMR